MSNERFAGVIVKIGSKFGFILLDDTNTKVFFHNSCCVGVDYRQLLIGDRVRFRVQENSSRPGKLIADRVTREVKT